MPDFPTTLSDRAVPVFPPSPPPIPRPLQFQVMLNGRSYIGQKILPDEVQVQGPLQLDCFGELCQIRVQFNQAPLMFGITLGAIVLPNPITSDGICLSIHEPTPEQRQGLRLLMDHFSDPDADVSTLLSYTDQLPSPAQSADWLSKVTGALRQRFFQ